MKIYLQLSLVLAFSLALARCGGTVNIKGQTYKTVQIGDQIWMAENLNLEVPNSYCYDKDPGNCRNYGRLYSWQAAKAVADLVPGWHLPTDEEWTMLTAFLGGTGKAGTSLKEGGSSGFNALLAGYRFSSFYHLGSASNFWSVLPKGLNSTLWHFGDFDSLRGQNGANSTRGLEPRS